MLRIFLILSLAVSLAGVVFSFVLKDKVTLLSETLLATRGERDTAIADATQARAAEKKAVAAEKVAREELDITNQELATKTAALNEVEGQLTRTAKDLQDTIAARDIAQRKLAQWEATGVEVDQIVALKLEGQRVIAERDAFREENRVMNREIARLNNELDVYRGKTTEIQMPDVHAQITGIDGNFQFVTLNKGSDDGLRQNGKMIITRGETLVAKVQLVRVESNSSIANLLPEWVKSDVQAGDKVMTSYEALTR
ncbi:MAG: hypothetical protein AB7O66_03880 [Limisphaerales bacterium]